MVNTKNDSKITKSILYSSPVLVAVALALVFSFSTIANHEETDDIIGIIDDNIITPPSSTTDISAHKIYNEYVTDPGNAAALKYEGNIVTISGVVASWSMGAGEGSGSYYDEVIPYLTLETDNTGEDKIKCYFPESFVTGLMDAYIGTTIVVTGTFTTIVNDYLEIVNCTSDDVFTAEDDMQSN